MTYGCCQREDKSWRRESMATAMTMQSDRRLWVHLGDELVQDESFGRRIQIRVREQEASATAMMTQSDR